MRERETKAQRKGKGKAKGRRKGNLESLRRKIIYTRILSRSLSSFFNFLPLFSKPPCSASRSAPAAEGSEATSRLHSWKKKEEEEEKKETRKRKS